MSIKTRRILYIVFILAFFTITPSLILYSLGYTLNNGFKLEKSGILVIESNPEGAKITINNKPVQKFWNKIMNSEENFIRTPAKLKNLKPGEYDIKIELPGYWPWTKKLSIKSGQTTFAEDVYLFRNEDAVLIKEYDQGKSSFSPNTEYFMNITDNAADLMNLKKELSDTYGIYDAATSSNPTSNLLWSKNNKKILSNKYIFSINDWQSPLTIPALLGQELSYFDWEDESENAFVYLQNDKLFSYNTNNNNNKELVNSDKIDKFLSKNNSVYFLKQYDVEKALHVWKNGQSESEVVLNLPDSEYEFINRYNEYINLQDKRNNILYIIDPNSKIKPLKDKIVSCKLAYWVNSKQILYTDGYEIWLYDLNYLEKKLLTRISENIIGLEWHPSNNYIIFATQKSLNILELDNREKHNITKIADASNMQNIALEKEGKIIYYTDQADGKTKLYKIFIQ